MTFLLIDGTYYNNTNIVSLKLVGKVLQITTTNGIFTKSFNTHAHGVSYLNQLLAGGDTE